MRTPGEINAYEAWADAQVVECEAYRHAIDANTDEAWAAFLAAMKARQEATRKYEEQQNAQHDVAALCPDDTLRPDEE